MKFFQQNQHIGLFLLRLFVSLRLIYGVIDNIISWNQMMEFSEFLRAQQFPFPTGSAVLSVYAQFIGAVLLLIGYKTRWAALLLIINFLIALIFFHFRINDSVEGMTPALAMLFGSLTLLFTGPGNWSIDKKLQQHHSKGA